MNWIFITIPAVNTLVFLFLLIAFVGMVSYFLYRVLLRPMVEEGEAHPANLRRGLWCLFLLLAVLAWLGMLWSVLTLAGKIAPIAIVVIVIIVLLVSLRRV